MTPVSAAPHDFGALRPQLLVLLDLHARAASDEDRIQIRRRLEAVFLETAWHVARDLLDHGYQPVEPARASAQSHLRLVSDVDAISA